MLQRARDVLKSVFGYDGFISLQERVIDNVLARRDTLAVMPTGAGKSVCYQVPALLFDGITVVASPLIALMKDQVDQLAQVGVPAVLLHSALSMHEHRRNVERLRQGEAKLLYAAPETLLKPQMLALLESLPVDCLAIDEAHCISEWGHDFRPEYRQLTDFRARMPSAVCIALTATATQRVRRDIQASLGFDDSAQFVSSFNRENLFLRVIPKSNPFRQALAFLERFPGEQGLVYCLTRAQVESLSADLEAEGFSVCPYHAGLSDKERNRNQEAFLRDEVRIIVATVAFGMGINKSNIRFVLHFDLPKNIESYYQEIGRAGRDGLRSECLLLFAPGDAQKVRQLILKKDGQERRAAGLQLNALVHFAQTDVCRRIPLLSYFGEAYTRAPCNMCDNCLAGERVLQDLTIPAQKFLSCVKRTGETFGTHHLIDVLRGSTAAKVKKFGHDRLSTYGIGKDLSRNQWQQLARQLLHGELMEQDPDFGGVKLTDRAWEVLRGKEPFHGALDGAHEAERALSSPGAESVRVYDAGLFELLRAKRKELADSANVPPYVVFSDRTLVEMAVHFPETPEDLLCIHGIGKVKQEQYGPIFLGIVNDYCREHSIERRPMGGDSVPPAPSAPRDPRPSKGRKHTVLGEAFNAGQAVEELAAEFGIKESTVLDNLYRFYQDGRSLRSEGLLPCIPLSPPDLEKVLAQFAGTGGHALKPVFEAFQGEISYDVLKVAKLYHLSLQRGEESADGPEGEGETVGRASSTIRTIVCLANSRKHSGFCIAGKEWESHRVGGWIRPVSTEAAGELSAGNIIVEDGRPFTLLDVISVPVTDSAPHPYQRENHVISGKRWTRRGAFPLARVEELCDEPESLWLNGFHSYGGLNDRMPLERVIQDCCSSLLLVRVDGLAIEVREGARGFKQVRARFMRHGTDYCLPVTDPLVTAEYLGREMELYPIEHAQAFLTLSISEPFEGFCYKLVAGIILRDTAVSMEPSAPGFRQPPSDRQFFR